MERRTRNTPRAILSLCIFSGITCAQAATPEEPGSPAMLQPELAMAPALTDLVSLPLGDDWRIETAIAPAAATAALDGPGLGSYAARLTYRATPFGQLSASFAAEFSGVHGGPAISAMLVQPFGDQAFAATARWGRTQLGGGAIQGFLLEGSFIHHARHQFFARATNVTRSDESTADAQTVTYPVTAGTLGYTYATRHAHQEIGIGFSITAFKLPPAMQQAYGEIPLAWQLHLRVQPSPAH